MGALLYHTSHLSRPWYESEKSQKHCTAVKESEASALRYKQRQTGDQIAVILRLCPWFYRLRLGLT